MKRRFTFSLRRGLNRLGRAVLACFTGANFKLHASAIVLTYLLIHSGFDWAYYRVTQIPILQDFLFPAVIIGGLGPVLLLLGLLLRASYRRDTELLNLTFALIEAAVLAIVITSFYKFFTGRVHPGTLLTDTSSLFRFGFLKGGLFWGWPSGHTATAFAMSVTFYKLRPQSAYRGAALLLALYIGLGVSTNIHWFSDFVAGVLVGTSIGRVAGKPVYTAPTTHF